MYVHRWINRDEDGKIKCGTICCDTPEGNAAWRERLKKLGFNYFVSFHEVRSRWALMFSKADVPNTTTPVRYRNDYPNLYKNPGYDLVNM